MPPIQASVGSTGDQFCGILAEGLMQTETGLTLGRGASRQIEIAKLLLRIRQHRSAKLNSAFTSIERSTDLRRIEELRQRMSPVYGADPVSAAKYADHRYWLLLNIRRAATLGLHTAAPLRILDIGCGPGYFIAAARSLGHDCQGVDVPQERFTAVERQVYQELLSATGCQPYTSSLLIERFTPLSFETGQFDLITAFWVCFNLHRQSGEWGLAEWKFFVEDAQLRLRPGGRLFLELNEHRERFGDLRYYDRETLAYFQSVGQVKGAYVDIRAK